MVTVVTGASGFLGGFVVRRLLADGIRVRCVDLEPSPNLDGLDVEWAFADVRDREGLRDAFRDAESVIHLAAVISVTGDPTGRVWETNVHGVRNAAEAALAADVGRFVHCSSVHAYDLETVDHVVETSPRAVAPHLPAYDRSKAAGEQELREVIAKGLDAVIVNPTGVYGPCDAHSRITRVILAMIRHRLPALIEGGFDWVDVRDVANSICSARTHGETGANYLLPGHHLSIGELAQIAEDVSGVPKPRITVPMRFARMWSPLAERVARRSLNPLWYTRESLHALEYNPTVSAEEARTVLGHDARSATATIEDIYHWAIREHLVAPSLNSTPE